MLRKPARAQPRPGAAQTPAIYTPARMAPATLTAAGCRMAVNTTDFWTRTLFSAGPPVEYASMDARPAHPPLSRTRPLGATQLRSGVRCTSARWGLKKGRRSALRPSANGLMYESHT